MKLFFKITFFVLFMIHLGANAQSWQVFYEGAQFNYKLDDSELITNVIFSDSITYSGGDTIYHLNRIATPCDTGDLQALALKYGTCDSCFVLSNQPQFLQRKIIKRNLDYWLIDTAHYYIPFNKNTWMFDSVHGITASIVNRQIVNIANILLDSVKTILLSTGDTIELSKSIGIIKYPYKFGSGKYFRLFGIDFAYDLWDTSSCYGTRMLGVFDFMNIKRGTMIDVSEQTLVNDMGNLHYTCHQFYDSVLSSYSFDTTTSTYHTKKLSHFSYIECQPYIIGSPTYYQSSSRIMKSNWTNTYPGQLVYFGYSTPTFYEESHAVIQYYRDSLGLITKGFGKGCGLALNSNKTNFKYSGALFYVDSQLFSYPNSNGLPYISESNSWIVKEKLGLISQQESYFEHWKYSCVNGVVLNGDTIGSLLSYNMLTSSNRSPLNIFNETLVLAPNPNNGTFTIINKNNELLFLKVFNLLGTCILLEKLPASENIVPVSLIDPQAGFYCYEICDINNSTIRKGKLIISK